MNVLTLVQNLPLLGVYDPGTVGSGLVDLTFYMSCNWRTDKFSSGNVVPRLMFLKAGLGSRVAKSRQALALGRLVRFMK